MAGQFIFDQLYLLPDDDDGDVNNPKCPHGRQLNEPCQDCVELDKLGRGVADRIMELQVENERLCQQIKDIAEAALSYENAVWLVKKYPSNGRYQRKLKKIYDQLNEARVAVGQKPVKMILD